MADTDLQRLHDLEGLDKGNEIETPQDKLTHPKNMGVSKNGGTPKWMVKIMENPMKMDDLEGKNPLFSE